MSPLVIPLLEFGKELIARYIPDKEAAAKAEYDMMVRTQQGDLAVTIEQLKINAVEAANPSLWVSGWRPFAGWIGGVGLLYQAVLHNILEWISAINGFPPPPAVDSEILVYVLTALLGIGGFRTYEKQKKLTK